MAHIFTSVVPAILQKYLSPVTCQQVYSNDTRTVYMQFCMKFIHASLLHMSGPHPDLIQAIECCYNAYSLMKSPSQSKHETLQICTLLYHITAKLPPREYHSEILLLSSLLHLEISSIKDSDNTKCSIAASCHASLWNQAINIESCDKDSGIDKVSKIEAKTNGCQRRIKHNEFVTGSACEMPVCVVAFKFRHLALKFLFLKYSDRDKVSGYACNAISVLMQGFEDMSTNAVAANVLVQVVDLCNDICMYEIDALSQNALVGNGTTGVVDVITHTFREMLRKRNITVANSLCETLSRYSLPSQFDRFNQPSCENGQTYLVKLLEGITLLFDLNETTSHEKITQTCMDYNELVEQGNDSLTTLDVTLISKLIELNSLVTLMANDLLSEKSALLTNGLLRQCVFSSLSFVGHLITQGAKLSKTCSKQDEVRKREDHWLSLHLETCNVAMRWLVFSYQHECTDLVEQDASHWLTIFGTVISSYKSKLPAHQYMQALYSLGLRANQLTQIAKSTGRRTAMGAFLESCCESYTRWCYSDKALTSDRLQQVNLWKLHDTLANHKISVGEYLIAMTTVVNRILVDATHPDHAAKVWVKAKLLCAREKPTSSAISLTLTSALAKAKNRSADWDVLGWLRCELRAVRDHRNVLAQSELAVIEEMLAVTDDPVERGVALVNVAQLLYSHPHLHYDRHIKTVINEAISILSASDPGDVLACMSLIDAYIRRYFIVQNELRLAIESVNGTGEKRENTVDESGCDVTISVSLESKVLADVDKAVSMIQHILTGCVGQYTDVLGDLCNLLDLCANIYSLVAQWSKATDARILSIKLTKEDMAMKSSLLLDSLLQQGAVNIAGPVAECLIQNVSATVAPTLSQCLSLVSLAQYYMLSGQLPEFYSTIRSVIESNVMTKSTTRHTCYIDGVCHRLLSQASLLQHNVTRLSMADGMTALRDFLKSALHLGQVCTMLGSARDASLYLKEGLKLADTLALPKWSVVFLEALSRLRMIQDCTTGVDWCMQKSRSILLSPAPPEDILSDFHVILSEQKTKQAANKIGTAKTDDQNADLSQKFFGFDEDVEDDRRYTVLNSIGRKNPKVESVDCKESRDGYLRSIQHPPDCDCSQCLDVDVYRMFLSSLTIEAQKLIVDGCINEALSVIGTLETLSAEISKFITARKMVRTHVNELYQNAKGKRGKGICECDSQPIGILIVEKLILESLICLETGKINRAKDYSTRGTNLIKNLCCFNPCILLLLQHHQTLLSLTCAKTTVMQTLLQRLHKIEGGKNHDCIMMDEVVQGIERLKVKEGDRLSYGNSHIGSQEKSGCKVNGLIEQSSMVQQASVKPLTESPFKSCQAENLPENSENDEVFTRDSGSNLNCSKSLSKINEVSSVKGLRRVTRRNTRIAQGSVQESELPTSQSQRCNRQTTATKKTQFATKSPSAKRGVDFDNIVQEVESVEFAATKTPLRSKPNKTTDFMTPKLLSARRMQALALLIEDDADDCIVSSTKKIATRGALSSSKRARCGTGGDLLECMREESRPNPRVKLFCDNDAGLNQSDESKRDPRDSPNAVMCCKDNELDVYDDCAEVKVNKKTAKVRNCSVKKDKNDIDKTAVGHIKTRQSSAKNTKKESKNQQLSTNDTTNVSKDEPSQNKGDQNLANDQRMGKTVVSSKSTRSSRRIVKDIESVRCVEDEEQYYKRDNEIYSFTVSPDLTSHDTAFCYHKPRLDLLGAQLPLLTMAVRRDRGAELPINADYADTDTPISEPSGLACDNVNISSITDERKDKSIIIDPIEIVRSGRISKPRMKQTNQNIETETNQVYNLERSHHPGSVFGIPTCSDKCTMGHRTSVEIQREASLFDCHHITTNPQSQYSAPEEAHNLVNALYTLDLTNNSEVASLLHDTFSKIQHIAPALAYRDISQICAMFHYSRDMTKAAFYLTEAQAITFRHRMIDNLATKERLMKSSKSGINKFTQMKKSIEFGSWTVDNFSHWCQYLPYGWTVCMVTTVTCFPGKQDVILTRLQGSTPPIVVVLPGIHTLHGEKILPEFSAILQASNASFSITNRQEWWRKRSALDTQLETLLGNMETHWLSHWRCLLLGDRIAHDKSILDAVTSKIEQDICAFAPELTPHIKLLLETIDMLSESELSSVVTHFTDLSPGTPNHDAVLASLHNHARELCLPADNARHPTILILDKNVQHLPWESLPSLRDHSISRVPSLHYMCSQLRYNLLADSSLFKQGIDDHNTWYILNPDNNLPSTQETFEDTFHRMEGWQGIVGMKPSKEQFSQAVTQHDLLIYCGHGSGSKYCHGDNLRKLECQATAILMGCSSGQLVVEGQLEATGMVQYYGLADCPCIVANLWEVTDRDIDRYLQKLLQTWLMDKSCMADDQSSADIVQSSVDVVRSSREACRLPYLVGAAPVVYGFPMYIRRHGSVPVIHTCQ